MTALAINVTIPDALRWSDTQPGQRALGRPPRLALTWRVYRPGLPGVAGIVSRV